MGSAAEVLDFQDAIKNGQHSAIVCRKQDFINNSVLLNNVWALN